MLEAVSDQVPEFAPFAHSAYSKPSTLFWGDKSLPLVEGMPQGDPLGPLLFCLTIHKLTTQLQSGLCLFHLDDGTLGGRAEVVLKDLQLIEQEAEELGLSLNEGKSEVITLTLRQEKF